MAPWLRGGCGSGAHLRKKIANGHGKSREPDDRSTFIDSGSDASKVNLEQQRDGCAVVASSGGGGGLADG